MAKRNVIEVEQYLHNHPAVRRYQPEDWSNDFSYWDYEILLFPGESWEDFFLDVMTNGPAWGMPGVVKASELCNGIIRFSLYPMTTSTKYCVIQHGYVMFAAGKTEIDAIKNARKVFPEIGEIECGFHHMIVGKVYVGPCQESIYENYIWYGYVEDSWDIIEGTVCAEHMI